MDVDLLSFPNIISHIKDLEYNNISGLFYKIVPREKFMLVKNDVDIMLIGSGLWDGDRLEFFIKECLNAGEVSNEKNK